MRRAGILTLANLYDISRAQIEHREKKRRARRRQIALSVAAASATVLAGLSFFAWRQRQDAIQQGRVSAARFLTDRAVFNESMSPSQGLRLRALVAAESLRAAWTNEGYKAWRLATRQMPPVISSLKTDSVLIRMAFSADAKTLIALCGKRHVHVLSVPELRELKQVEASETAYELAIDSRGERALAYKANDEFVEAIDVKSGSKRSIFLPGAFRSAAFTPAGEAIAVSTSALWVIDAQSDQVHTLQAGLRYDYNKIQTRPDPQSTDPAFQTLNASRLSNALTASLGAIQQLTSQLTGSVSLARSFRAPTVQELFANGLDAPSGTYTIGTPGLGPETGLGADASLKGNFANASFEISPYVNSISHYIYGFLRGDTIQGFPVRQFGATDARLFGFDASVTVQPAQYFALKAGADYVNAEDTRQNVPLPFTPPLRGLVRATFQDQTYMGMIETRLAARQTRLGEGDTPTPGYTVVNLGVGMRFARQRVVNNISIHCDNVFNRVYRDNLSVIKDFIPQPGRGLTVELSSDVLNSLSHQPLC